MSGTLFEVHCNSLHESFKKAVPCPMRRRERARYGRKKTAVAVALCKTGSGVLKLNGCPMDLITPDVLKMKVSRDDFATVLV